MVDETTDASNHEQVVLCLCWVSDYEVLQELWNQSLDIVKDSEMKARINGLR